MTKTTLRYLSYETIENVVWLADACTDIKPDHQLKQRILPSVESMNRDLLDQQMTVGLPPSHIALLRKIQTLAKGELIELAALIWFGRGDASFKELLAYAQKSYGIMLPYYLVQRPLLGDYLRHGWHKLTEVKKTVRATKKTVSTGQHAVR